MPILFQVFLLLLIFYVAMMGWRIGAPLAIVTPLFGLASYHLQQIYQPSPGAALVAMLLGPIVISAVAILLSAIRFRLAKLSS